MFRKRIALVVPLLATCGMAVGCGLAGERTTAETRVFTSARPSVGAAVLDFFGHRPVAPQPFPFPHSTHVEKKLSCTDYCHESAEKGPIAGLPSVKTCMICHESIAVDRPLIKALADYRKRGHDISWQRVYGYVAQSHVRFDHRPHVLAKVDCATCHGNVAQQTVAERNVDLSMGFCVGCHKARQAPNECVTCHF